MPLGPEDVRTLERRLAELEDVLGVVVLDGDNESDPVEVQLFLPDSIDDPTLRDRVRAIAADIRPGVAVDVSLFHVTVGRRGPADDGTDPAADGAAAGPQRGARPRILSVVLDSSASVDRHQAVVALAGDVDHLGRAELGGEPLLAVVRATCDAVRSATGGATVAEALGLKQPTVGGIPVVVVTVSVAGRILVGAAAVGDEPVQTTTVRATLDALNRWISGDPGRSEQR